MAKKIEKTLTKQEIIDSVLKEHGPCPLKKDLEALSHEDLLEVADKYVAFGFRTWYELQTVKRRDRRGRMRARDILKTLESTLDMAYFPEHLVRVVINALRYAVDNWRHDAMISGEKEYED